jgi:hypothetical protein
MALYGAYITQYKIYVRHSDGVFFSEATDCVGTDPDLLANTYCEVLVSTLKANPFALSDGEPVFVKVVAINVIGESEASSLGTGATIFTPIVPGAPINLANDPAGTNMNQASFSWEDSSTGGKIIIDYKI